MTLLPAFIRERPGLALFATLAVATSGFGQTFFLSVFGEQIRGAFDLSHTLYGGLYSLATVISACMLLKWGRLADTWSLPRATILAVGILAVGCLFLGLANGVVLLFLGFLGIRFGGQGLISHLGLTTAARYFSAHRGKAVALAAGGFPLAEAVLPPAGVFLVGLWGWRFPWVAGSVLLLVCILPLLVYLTRDAPSPESEQSGSGKEGPGASFTRKEVLRDRGFYFLLPATMASPFMVTALLFHQAAIASIQDWPMQAVGTAFTGYAAGHLCALLGGGPLVDRISAGRTLPMALFPMAAGLFILSIWDGIWVVYVYLTLMGVTHGLASTAAGAVWAERYGILHLGAIRSLAQAAVIFSTAVAPLLIGYVLDAGVSPGALAAFLTGLTLMSALLARLAPAPAKGTRKAS